GHGLRLSPTGGASQELGTRSTFTGSAGAEGPDRTYRASLVETAQPIRLVAFDWGGVILKHHRSWAESCASAGVEVRAGHDLPDLISQRRALNLLFQCGRMSPEDFYPAM